MIDIHSHLLHGLDDGSKTLENSVEMARMAADDGITRMVCTPHASYSFEYKPDLVAARIEELRSAINAAGIELEIAQGCDFHLSFDNIEDACAHNRRYTLNGGNYLLVELADMSIPPTLGDVLYNLRIHGMIPILTHPERNATISTHPEMMAPWIEHGLLVQVTANSLTGGMGRRAEKVAHRLLQQGWVHFVATDAHNLSSRPPRLREAYDLVRQKTGEANAQALFIENPLAAWEGRALPAQHAYEPAPERRKPSFFARLFGRG